MSGPHNSIGIRHRIDIWLAARVLPLLIFNRNLEQTLKLIEVSENKAFCGVSPEQISEIVIATTRRPWFMRKRRCLRQGILGMRYLRMAGYDPILRFGIDTKSISKERLNAHCWVELEGKAVINDSLADMIVIHSVHESVLK